MTDDLVKRLRDVDHLCVEDCFLQSPLYAYAADRIEQLERERETLVQAHDAMVETLRESGRKRIVSEALLDKAVVALRETSSFLWHMTNAIDDEDYKGPHDGFNVPLVCHVQPYHDLHVEQLKTQAENVNAVLAEIDGGRKDD